MNAPFYDIEDLAEAEAGNLPAETALALSEADKLLRRERRPSRHAIARRKEWRKLQGPCAPTAWLSDETLENLDSEPRRLTLKQIRQAVTLANAAPDLLAVLGQVADEFAALDALLSSFPDCDGANRLEVALNLREPIVAAIAKAKATGGAQ